MVLENSHHSRSVVFNLSFWSFSSTPQRKILAIPNSNNLYSFSTDLKVDTVVRV